jgi:hypothetical protein
VSFIQAHQSRWSVEPIGRVLPIAPSSYDAAAHRAPSARRWECQSDLGPTAIG